MTWHTFIANRPYGARGQTCRAPRRALPASRTSPEAHPELTYATGAVISPSELKSSSAVCQSAFRERIQFHPKAFDTPDNRFPLTLIDTKTKGG